MEERGPFPFHRWDGGIGEENQMDTTGYRPAALTQYTESGSLRVGCRWGPPEENESWLLSVGFYNLGYF